MNLGKTCEFIYEQIRIDKAIRGDESIDAAKIREYILEHLDMVGIDKNLLRSRKSAGELTSDSPYNFPDTALPFLTDIIKKRSTKPFKRMRQRKYTEAALDERVWVLDGWANVLRSIGKPQNVIDEQSSIIDERLCVTYSWGCEKLNGKHQDLLDAIWSVPFILFVDRKLLTEYIVANADHSDEELIDLFEEYKEYRFEERSELASSVAENRSYDQAFIQEHIIIQQLTADEEYLAIQKKIDEFVRRKGIIYRDKAKFNRLLREREKIIKKYKDDFGDDYAEPPELVCECAHPLVVLKECLEAIDERKKPFTWK